MAEKNLRVFFDCELMGKFSGCGGPGLADSWREDKVGKMKLKCVALMGLFFLLATAVQVVSAQTGQGQVVGSDVAVREDIASRLYTLTGKQYGESKTASRVKNQLDLLWRQFPDYRAVSKESASRIEALWAAESQHITQDKDDSVQANEIALLIWQTYHCLVADHHPLAPEETKRKSTQLEKLAKVLEQFDSEVTWHQTDIPRETREMIREESRRCIIRLNDYSNSPQCPLFYYPLHDAAFGKAVDAINSQAQKEIQRFREEYSDYRKKLLEEAMKKARTPEKNADFFQRSLRNWSNLQAKSIVSLTMGNIVRHYCMVDRNLNYDDSAMFPFWKVKGIGVAYKMQEGLSMELKVDWKVLTPPPK